MNTNVIQSILAGFLDKFKAKSPLVFVIIASVLTGTKFFALVLNSGTFSFKNQE